MSVADDRLLTTTLPFPTRCTTCRRWYAAFKARFARWNETVFSNKVLSLDTPAPDHIDIPPELLDVILGFPHTMNVAQCRTKPPPALRQLLAGLDVTVEALETHGGMGRIYTLRDTAKILKVADIRTSWCKYEPANYALLKSRGIPCTHLDLATTRTVHVPGVAVDAAYVVMVLERLDCTLTACIRAMARAPPDPARSPAHIAAILQRVLDTLAANGLVYGDLSPDNIMFRFVGGTRYELALIDPQFVVPLEAFKVAMGPARATAFDTTYLALKIQAIGILDPVVAKFADAVCAHILGHTTPLEKHTRRWLLHEAPVGLFLAYNVLREANKKSSRLK